MPFKPGQSGNPGGRPKEEAQVIELARKAAPAAIKRLVELSKSTDPKVAMYAANAVLDRAIGKPKQQVDLGTEDGPLQIHIVRYSEGEK